MVSSGTKVLPGTLSSGFSTQENPTTQLSHRLSLKSCDLLYSSLAPTSRKVYSKVWQLLSTYQHDTFGEEPSFSLTNHKTDLFIAYMEMIGLSRNTVSTYLSALGHPHRLAGVADPTATFSARKIVETVGKGRVPSPL